MRKPRRQSEQNRWTRDTAKESYWRAQMSLWQKSGLSVRAYCKEQGVIETSFYAWRRELTVRARESNATQNGNSVSTVKDARGRTIPMRFRETEMKSLIEGLEANPFIPLSVVQKPGRSESSSSLGLSVTTPSGYKIVIAGSADLILLKETLSILENH